MDVHPIFQICPHGTQPPYCVQCLTDELNAKLEAKRQEASVQRVRAENKRLRGTVSNQSAALDAAYAQIRNLQRKAQQIR
jgi:hypothetical protein